MNILLIEDDRDVQVATALNLRMRRHAVVCANNGVEGLAEARDMEDVLHVIILDWKMPTLDGAGFLREYKGKLPVVITTGFDDVAPGRGIIVVRKPYDMKELMAAIEKLTGIKDTFVSRMPL